MNLEELITKLRGEPVRQATALPEWLSDEKLNEIKRRELRRFKDAQDKKWRNWIESVSR